MAAQCDEYNHGRCRYVGLKDIEPALDTGLPLAESYTAALEAYQSGGQHKP